MPVDPNILIAFGAAMHRYKKGTFIFRQDEMARFYFQIMEGEVKTYNVSHNTKEFVQGLFRDGESFGEPSLFMQEVYPTHAIATKDSVIFKLSKDTFFTILGEYSAVQMTFLKIFAQRMFDHSMAVRMLTNTKPELRILDFLDTYKKKTLHNGDRVLVAHTRQEIANLTGLRVETVIRTLSRLKEKKKVEILDHKLYY